MGGTSHSSGGHAKPGLKPLLGPTCGAPRLGGMPSQLLSSRLASPRRRSMCRFFPSHGKLVHAMLADEDAVMGKSCGCATREGG